MDADYEEKLKEYGDNARKVLNIAEKRENTKKDEKSSKNAIDKTTKQSYKEVYDIICNMEKEMQSKIPQNFISFIKENINVLITQNIKVILKRFIIAQNGNY